MYRFNRLVAGTAIAFAAFGATCTIMLAEAGAHDGEVHDPAPAEVGELTGRERQVIRSATKQFRDVDVAIAAGYLPTDACAELPGVGGMGLHYVNPALLGDGVIDPTRPEVLLYAPTKQGGVDLVGVEYMAVDADQDLATDDDRPSMLGHPLEGPMPGHEPGMPVHYDLHAWVFSHNPDGNLATWNPALTCPQV